MGSCEGFGEIVAINDGFLGNGKVLGAMETSRPPLALLHQVILTCEHHQAHYMESSPGKWVFSPVEPFLRVFVDGEGNRVAYGGSGGSRMAFEIN